MKRPQWCITMDVLPVLPLGRTQLKAYARLDSARGWTAADITRAGGCEDGAGPLLAAALDRSSGVGCFRDHIAADLVTVADAPLGASLQAPLVRACREDLVADFDRSALRRHRPLRRG